MDRHVAEQWTAALRSGEYKQTSGCLRSDGQDGESRYCCLGVLCELAIRDGVAIKRAEEGYTEAASEKQHNTMLPETVQTWAGMYSTAGAIESGGALTQINDDGWDFEDIADLIEERVDDL